MATNTTLFNYICNAIIKLFRRLNISHKTSPNLSESTTIGSQHLPFLIFNPREPSREFKNSQEAMAIEESNRRHLNLNKLIRERFIASENESFTNKFKTEIQ